MGSKKKNKLSAGNSAVAGENGKGKQVIADPRFAKVHSDPRFQKLPKHKAKVSIDDRFSRMFTDKRFAGSSAPLDKRGKPKKHSENALRRYYRQEEDDNEEEEKKREKKRKEEEESEGNSSESPGSESDVELELDSESESESDGDLESDASTSTTDTDDETEVLGDEASVEVENVALIEKETHRLAIVNMDWNHVKAADLFMMLSSFLPKGGQIKSVAVYPSEFGLQRMKEEAVRGPAALFDDEKKDSDNDDEDNDDEIDPEKLRAYEKSRMRYYYAVVECDSIATADHLYKECDGVEFERSSNILDLRFIPDSMEFKHPPRDVATEAPIDYDGLDFNTRALQHSDVVLSWDDDEPHRVKTLTRKFNEKQLAELELKEFLASEESESDEDENDNEDTSGEKEKKLEKYRALLQSGDGSEEDNDNSQEMEVTFNAGLEDLSTKILEKKNKGSETVWEAYLRKRKEKKKARKSRSKNSSEDESYESDQELPAQPDDFFEEDPSVERTKKAVHSKKNRDEKRSLEDKAAEASRAELELLLADENGAADNKVKGYKIKQKKGKKGKEVPDEDKIPAVDHDDTRFSALFTNPEFALDPTEPHFKRSATYFKQLAKRQHKGREEHGERGSSEVPRETLNDSVEKEEKQSVHASQKEKHELSSIVKSIKMKSQQLPTPSRLKSKKDMGSNGSVVKEKKHKLPSLDRPKQKKAKV